MNSLSVEASHVVEYRMESHAVRTISTLMIIVGAMAASIVLGISAVEGPESRPSYVLVSTINPNKASRARLLCLPGIGPARAQAIVHYRQLFRYSEQVEAFQDANDLTKIKGISTAIIDQMHPWLSFTRQ